MAKGREPWLAAASAAVFTLVVYLLTLAPSIPPGDSGDLITSAVVLGIAHPPGYPLATMLGHLFTLLPLGTPAYRVNLMSALLATGAIALVAFLIAKVATDPLEVASPRRGSWLAIVAGATGALLLAFSTQFWLYSVVAEVFALNNFFAAALLLLALIWYRRPTRRWALWLFFLVAGLASSNQQTIVLLGPGLAILLVAGIRRRNPRGSLFPDRMLRRELLIGVGLLLVGLSPYLYLPIAAAQDPVLNWGNPQTLDAFIRLVTRADYGSGQLIAGGAHGSVLENFAVFFGYLPDGFGVGGCVLAVAGLWALRRARIVGLALITCFVVAGPVFLAYANPPIPPGIIRGIIARFYILPSVPFAVIAGLGAHEILMALDSVLRSVRFRRLAPMVAGVAAVVMLALPLSTAAAHWAITDQSSNYVTRNLTEDLLRPLEPNAILLTVGDTSILGSWYIQHAEGYRPDVTVVALPLLTSPWYVQQLRRQQPDLVIPFDVYAPANGADTGKLVDANIAKRPVYYVGVITDKFPPNYDELRVGFARQFVPKGQAPDPFAWARTHLAELEQFKFPTQTFPDWTWETWEAAFYSSVAFDIANAYEQVDTSKAEGWYRRAITLGPDNPGAYKNLAILLNSESRNHDEVVALLQQFLRLSPNDPDAQTIRTFLGTNAP
jgi:4-amino-4-deoxy-L-arabinose transferase and related glycosyltransferases of PMT family